MAGLAAAGFGLPGVITRMFQRGAGVGNQSRQCREISDVCVVFLICVVCRSSNMTRQSSKKKKAKSPTGRRTFIGPRVARLLLQSSSGESANDDPGTGFTSHASSCLISADLTVYDRALKAACEI